MMRRKKREIRIRRNNIIMIETRYNEEAYFKDVNIFKILKYNFIF